jgi:cyanophycinase-like exopeptidase
LQRVLVDTHFTQRDRLGRLVVFLARAYSTPLLGVGIDERTALIVEANGAARVIGSGKVHVVSADQAPETLSDGEPLTYRHLPMQSFSPGATFTLGADALTGEIDCVAGKL